MQPSVYDAILPNIFLNLTASTKPVVIMHEAASVIGEVLSRKLSS
jgi:hypothetical protein